MRARSAFYHSCPVCGANLDPGEKCECERAVNATRAVCPLFHSRADVGRKHFVLCARSDGRVATRVAEATADARNAYYAAKCCGNYAECGVWQIAQKIPHGVNCDPAALEDRVLSLAVED